MSLQDGFTDKMQAARDQAARARHLGKAGGRAKFAKRAPLEDTAENRFHAELARLQAEIRDRDHTISLLRTYGTDEIEPIDDAGAEFDRLFAGAKKVGPGLPAEPRSPQHPATPARTRGTHTMTKNQYLAALKKLDLSPASRATAAALGLTVRQCQRLAAGDSPIPETVALLLTMYLEHGLPEQDD